MNNEIREEVLYYLSNFNHFKREVKREIKENREHTSINAVRRWYDEFNGFYYACCILIGCTKTRSMKALIDAMFKVFIELKGQC